MVDLKKKLIPIKASISFPLSAIVPCSKAGPRCYNPLKNLVNFIETLPAISPGLTFYAGNEINGLMVMYCKPCSVSTSRGFY